MKNIELKMVFWNKDLKIKNKKWKDKSLKNKALELNIKNEKNINNIDNTFSKE